MVPSEVYPLEADRQEAHILLPTHGMLPDLNWSGRIDAVVVDVESLGWLDTEIRMFESRLIAMDYRKRFDRDGVRLWVRRPGA
jgi:hypothetical protein